MQNNLKAVGIAAAIAGVAVLAGVLLNGRPGAETFPLGPGTGGTPDTGGTGPTTDTGTPPGEDATGGGPPAGGTTPGTPACDAKPAHGKHADAAETHGECKAHGKGAHTSHSGKAEACTALGSDGPDRERGHGAKDHGNRYHGGKSCGRETVRSSEEMARFAPRTWAA